MSDAEYATERAQLYYEATFGWKTGCVIFTGILRKGVFAEKVMKEHKDTC